MKASISEKEGTKKRILTNKYRVRNQNRVSSCRVNNVAMNQLIKTQGTYTKYFSQVLITTRNTTLAYTTRDMGLNVE